MNTIQARIYYGTLTNVYSKQDVALLSLYTLIKSQSEFTSKPGFLSNSELSALASYYKEYKNPIRTVTNRLNRLVRYGYIVKNRYGYVLTAYDTVLNNIHSLTPSTSKTGAIYHPFKTVAIPSTSDTRIIELLRMYYLLKQIDNRKEPNGLNSKPRNRKYKLPERLSIALDYLRKAGKYSSKNVVLDLLQQLQQVGLIRIEKHGFNYTDMTYNQNSYLIYDISRAKWNQLKPIARKVKTKSFIETLKAPRAKDVNVKSETVKVKAVCDLTARFKNFVKFNLYRAITRAGISKALNEILSDSDLKDKFLSEFGMDNIVIEVVEKKGYDIDAHRDLRNYSYTVQHAQLVDRGGNYNGELLVSYSTALEQAKEKRKDYYFNLYTSKVKIEDDFGSGIEDIEDYQMILNASLEKVYGRNYFPFLAI